MRAFSKAALSRIISRRAGLTALCALVCAAAASPAVAGGAYCSPEWRPENGDLGCSSQITIAPGNDSRINLFLLLQDKAGRDGAKLAYPDLNWRTFYGRNFLQWQNLRAAWYPPEPADEGFAIYGGDRCQTVDTGRAVFLEALEANGALDSANRAALIETRNSVSAACAKGPDSRPLPGSEDYVAPVTRLAMAGVARDFQRYNAAAEAFYDGNWQQAARSFARLGGNAADPWVRETARYMQGRTALNEAIAGADDRWGWFALEKVDSAIAKRAEDGLRSYLGSYPDGRYAASAQGLIRRTLWLQSDFARLAEMYAPLLAEADPASEQTATLIEEVDDKLLVRARDTKLADPYLLAARNLMRMRGASSRWAPTQTLSAQELAGQAKHFVDHPELYTFLRANHAFYVQGEPAPVLTLLPDDARRDSYTPLAFSRQYLRGLALHALGDRNEEGFWRELIGGANGIWQRPAVELALARLMEQKGRTDAVFAPGSPITDPRIRRILLGSSAGPAVLKAQARDAQISVSERSFALFTVLLRQLQTGAFAGFGADYGLLDSYPPTKDDEIYLYNVLDQDIAPLAVFARGKWSDGYACPSIDETAAHLAKNSRNIDARLCLGDFYRLNGLDDFAFGYRMNDPDKAAELGSGDGFYRAATPRHAFYESIIGDPRATQRQRAYALYRAVRCYAPTNNNTCGGPGVAKAQRAAWFRTLKRQYGDTQWARDLEYYW